VNEAQKGIKFLIDLFSQCVIYFPIAFFEFIAMQTSFHPADGIAHGTVSQD
jgi:hypothetical protein